MVYTLPSKYMYPNSTTLDSLTTTLKGWYITLGLSMWHLLWVILENTEFNYGPFVTAIKRMKIEMSWQYIEIWPY